jgi:uncharacterized membrane protein
MGKPRSVPAWLVWAAVIAALLLWLNGARDFDALLTRGGASMGVIIVLAIWTLWRLKRRYD